MITALRYLVGLLLSLGYFFVGLIEILVMLPGYIVGFINRKIFLAGAMWCLDITEKEVARGFPNPLNTERSSEEDKSHEE